MPKRKPIIELYSFGIYEPWDRNSKTLPKLYEITTKIPVEPEVEFGYVIKIQKAKGCSISFIMHHPPFTDEYGNISPSFEGEVYITSNDWSFFLGDTVWPPYDDKVGKWELITFLDGEEIARKSFELYENRPND